MTKLTPVQERLILHWGEMGTRWGINRTVAQIHALLYLSEEPLNADQLSETLKVARSNVSMSLKELSSWGIVKVEPRIGDRKEYYTTLTDVWEMFRRILAERKKREIDPTLSLMRECAMELEEGGESNAYQAERIKSMLEFMETTTSAYEQLDRLPTSSFAKLARMSERITKLLSDFIR